MTETTMDAGKPMHDSVLAQVAALPEKSMADLKQLWRELYDREPPPFNKPFLVKRLAYRIQELAYGGLSARAEAKLTELIDEEDRRVKGKQPVRKGDRPIVGTRLIREWQGVEHCVTVLDDGFEYQGRPVPVAVGDRPSDHRHAVEWPAVLGPSQSPERQVKAPSRKIRAAIYCRVSTEERLGMEFNSFKRSKRRAKPTLPARGAKAGSSSPTRTSTQAYPAAHGATGFAAAAARRRTRRGRCDRHLQDRPAQPLDFRLREARRAVRPARDHVRRRVTQSFATTTSMGRLTLNILMSFAEFERDLAGERIRDKFAASRRAACGWAAPRRSATTSSTASWW